MRHRLLPFIVVGALSGLASAVVMPCRAAEDTRSLSASTTARRSRPLGSAIQHAFIYNHGRVLQRELSPTDVRYNPVALLREEDLTPKELFETEPRDVGFAPVLEQRIRTKYADAFEQLDIADRIMSINVECKTLSCYTEVEVAKEDGLYVYDRINGLLLGSLHAPGLTSAGTPDLMTITLYTLFEPELRDEHYYQRFLDQLFYPLVASFKAEYSRRPDD